jgi:hypothetical protein
MTPVPLELGLKAPRPGIRSCATCPSAMSDTQIRDATGKGFGGPGCASKSLPISLPNAPQKVRDNTAQHIAKDCDMYGLPFSGIDPGAADAAIAWGPVFFPKPNPASGLVRGGMRVMSCQGCAHFVPAPEVMDQTGWNGGACLAKGKLLLTDRLSKYARGCFEVQPVDALKRGSLDGVTWFPEYTKTFGEIDKSKMSAKLRSIDPLDWPTDKTLSNSDKLRGIRSWRKIDDPEGVSAPGYLPIYNPETFTKDEQELIPRTGDAEHPEIYHDHGGFVHALTILWTKLDGTPAAWGPAGVGKTELGRHMAWLMQSPFHRISITGTSEIDDLAGSKEYSPDQGTHFQEGRLPRYWRRPGIILLDEPNVGPPEVWQFIRPLTDNSKQLVLDMAGGLTVPRHPDCYFMLAMNPAWDMRNIGTNTIGDADARRLLHVWMDLPPAETEKEIITDWCMTTDGYDPKDHLDNIMVIATDIRAMCAEGALPITWGLANQIKLARLMQHFSPMAAYKHAVLNYLDPAIASLVTESILSRYPS